MPVSVCILCMYVCIVYVSCSAELLKSKRNKEGRLYFKATSEEDAFAWLVPLRILCKDHNLAAQVTIYVYLLFVPFETDTVRELVYHK